MIWSIDTDDFHGFCSNGNKKFGIIATIAETLFGSIPTGAPTIASTATPTRPMTTTTTTPGNTDEGDGHPICGNTAGLKPDPDNCEKYYSCQKDGQGSWLVNHLTCTTGLLFDQAQLYCNWPQEAQCDINQNKVQKIQSSFICPGEGYFPDGICTPHFYECVSNSPGHLTAYEFYCPVHTVFDKYINVCNYPYLVEDCQDHPHSTSTTSSPSPLPPSDICYRIGLNENPYEHCSQIYYDCQLNSDGSSWKTTQLRCDANLYFDPDTLSCTQPNNIEDCQDLSTTLHWRTTTTVKPKPTTTTPMITTTTSSDPNKICNHPGLNPDPHNPRDCGVYYSCKPAPNYPGHWLITECHCDQGLAFDPLLEVCTWPSSLDDCPNNGPSYFRLKIVGKSDDECIARLFTPF